MKNRLVPLLILLVAILTFGGCASSDTPSGALELFIKSAQSEDEETFLEVTKNGDQFFKERDQLIAGLNYDEDSSKKIKKIISDVSFETVNEKENDKTATLDVKIKNKNLAEKLRNDTFKGIIAYKNEFKPLKNDFKNINDLEKKVKVYLIKKDDKWCVDLSNEKNADLLNALVGNLIKASNDFFEIEKVTTKNKEITFPENHIKFLDGNKQILVNANPKLENGNLVPYYNPLRDKNFIPGWDASKNTLTAVKSNKVLSVPFGEYKLATHKIYWPNIKKQSLNSYTRENIGVSDKSWCDIEIMNTTSKKGIMANPLMCRENNYFMSCGLSVIGAGENIEQPIVLYIDGEEIGKTQRKGESAFDAFPEMERDFYTGDVVEVMTLSDAQAKKLQSIGHHLAEIIQVNGENQVVYYQTIPYEVKDY
ncbi:hypothetical protein ACKQTC_00610 [Peptococcus simiae]|uniref:Lipoprotein n=1 Tax=Peptococcus simiae TaxID=1643805 RepID=A0ABW9GXL0_9FIRM